MHPSMEDEMADQRDRDRLWELQQQMSCLAQIMPLTAPPMMALAMELDELVNKLMDIPPRTPGRPRSQKRPQTYSTR